MNEEKKKSKKNPFRILGKVSMLLHLGLPKKILSETEKVKYYKTKSSEEEKEKPRKGRRKEGEKGRKTGEEKKTKLENEEQNLVIVPTPPPKQTQPKRWDSQPRD